MSEVEQAPEVRDAPEGNETTDVPAIAELGFIEARRFVRELPDDADFEALLAAERAREKGPRPSVMREIERRIRGDVAPAKPVVPELDEAPWTEHTWRGHKLYKCKHCEGVQSFDVGVMYTHAQRFHPTTTRK